MLRSTIESVRKGLGASPGFSANGDGSISPSLAAVDLPAALAPLREIADDATIPQFAMGEGQGAKTYDIVSRSALKAKIDAMFGVSGQGQKSTVQDPFTLRNIFDMCDFVEAGLAVQPRAVRGSNLVNWIGRAMANRADKMKIPYWDFRGIMGQYELTAKTIDEMFCDAPVCTTPARPIGKASLEYCFDPKLATICVNPYQYEAWREHCMAHGFVSIFGTRYDPHDPNSMVALDDALTMRTLEDHRIRQMVTRLLEINTGFAAKHPELTIPELLPPPAVSLAPASGTCENITDYPQYICDVAKIIWNQIRQMKVCVKNQFGGELRDGVDYVLAMNANDALCLMWAQVCIQKMCPDLAELTISVAPNQINDALFTLEQQFQARLRGGKYGFGYLKMPDGSRLDIMAEDYDINNTVDPLIPSGTVMLRVSGWGGDIPNTWGLKFVDEDYSMYLAHLGRAPNAAGRIRTLGLGNAVEIYPANPCAPRQIGFNTCLMTNVPWLQVDFTELCVCSDFQFGDCILPLPAVGSIVPCSPGTC